MALGDDLTAGLRGIRIFRFCGTHLTNCNHQKPNALPGEIRLEATGLGLRLQCANDKLCSSSRGY